MSVYTEVEQPFLQQLANLGWNIIDQGCDIPSNPALSLRQNFRQWILPELFAQSVSAMNTWCSVPYTSYTPIAKRWENCFRACCVFVFCTWFNRRPRINGLVSPGIW
jgi:hypothetical protein